MPDLRRAADALTEMARLLGLTEKSRRAVAQEYRAQLYEYADQAMTARMDATDLARAHRELIRMLAPQMYVEALKANGIGEDEMDDTDRAEIANWIATQLPHVRDFAKAARMATDTAAQAEIARRIDLWVAALENLGQLAFASAQKNAMGTWVYGDTEHCETCSKLNGKQHRISWYIKNGYIPQEVGSTTLDCGGWNCQCRVMGKDGKRLL